MRPQLLDLFCGAGGAAMGYYRAGFDVVGVDIKKQSHYPFDFIQADALNPPVDLEAFDAIHASPPCQAYTNQGRAYNHPRLIEAVRLMLVRAGLPFIIENVVGAPLIDPIILCGSMFDLGVRRHRKFESNTVLYGGQCSHRGREVRAYYGAWGREAFRAKKPGNKDTLRGTLERAPTDMGIDWMQWTELTQAIPPVYTEFIGRQLIAAI